MNVCRQPSPQRQHCQQQQHRLCHGTAEQELSSKCGWIGFYPSFIIYLFCSIYLAQIGLQTRLRLHCERGGG